ncbi:MAG: amino acid ABC transporter permease [Campylobacterota bacterium]|nr:amino acid ABC transporter permease [Campylobacterota bacterium]
MSRKLNEYFDEHKMLFFILNLLFIVLLLKCFQVLAFPDADFQAALTAGNIEFMMFGMRDELGGFVLTFAIAIIAMLFSFVFGSLLGIARYSNIKILKIPATIYIELFRALPLIMVIFWVYFAIPIVGAAIFETKIALSALISAIISFTLFESAYIAEIVRAGINSIPKGQFEAAKTLGMNSWQISTIIILPQAYRRMIPAISSQFVSLFKDTSLVYVIGVVEFFRAATIVNNRIYMSFEILSFVAIVYFVSAFTLSKIAEQLEKKVAKQLHA